VDAYSEPADGRLAARDQAPPGGPNTPPLCADSPHYLEAFCLRNADAKSSWRWPAIKRTKRRTNALEALALAVWLCAVRHAHASSRVISRRIVDQ